MRSSLLRFSAATASAVALFAFSAGNAHAQAFTATYDFSGTTGDQPSEPVDAQPTGATLTNIVRGSGITPSAAGNSFSATGFTTAATIDVNDYFAFSITPTAGNQVSLSSLDFTTRRSGTGPVSIAVRSSRDGFAANIFTTTQADVTVSRRDTVALTGVAFQNLTTNTEFRIFAFAAEAAGGTFRLGVSGAPGSADNPTGLPNNLQLSGTVAAIGGATAPEPGALALLGAVVPFGLVAAARRRKAA